MCPIWIFGPRLPKFAPTCTRTATRSMCTSISQRRWGTGLAPIRKQSTRHLRGGLPAGCSQALSFSTGSTALIRMIKMWGETLIYRTGHLTRRRFIFLREMSKKEHAQKFLSRTNGFGILLPDLKSAGRMKKMCV